MTQAVAEPEEDAGQEQTTVEAEASEERATVEAEASQEQAEADRQVEQEQAAIATEAASRTQVEIAEAVRAVLAAPTVAQMLREVNGRWAAWRDAPRGRSPRGPERRWRRAERTARSYLGAAERHERAAYRLRRRLAWARFIPGVAKDLRAEIARVQAEASRARSEARWWREAAKAEAEEFRARRTQREAKRSLYLSAYAAQLAAEQRLATHSPPFLEDGRAPAQKAPAQKAPAQAPAPAQKAPAQAPAPAQKAQRRR